jgi:NAD(P)-dependent dehydrogenase (short-subunit alcohol dehydrogenase family)
MYPTSYINSLFNVQGKVVVLTGGGGVICSTLGKGYAKAGAKVALLDINLDAAKAAADAIVAEGGEAIGVQADVLDRAKMDQAVQEVLDAYGTVDVLVNGAGGNNRRATTSAELSFFDLPQDAFQWVFNLNFVGTLLPTQAFGKVLAEKGEGVIINIASVNAFRPLTNIPAYSAAKAAVKNFTEWFAAHISLNYSKNIRVNAIAPGFYLTEQNRFLLTKPETGEMTERGKTIVGHTPMGRYGETEELIGTVLWLSSPAAQFVHGVTVLVDGGFIAYGGV